MPTPSIMTVGGGIGRAMPDLLASPTGATSSGQSAGDALQLSIPFQQVRLVELTHNHRFYRLDRLEAYFRAVQDDQKRYDWDGNLMGYGEEADIKPGWYVPYKKRKPAARYDLAKVVVNRMTNLLFGVDRFPEIRVDGDELAEDYVKALCEASRLPMRMAEARSLGGSTGAVGTSFGFVKGEPRVEAHNAKHCNVLRWVDEHEHVVGAVLKAYCYQRQVWDDSAKKLREVTYYYARYWDETQEIVWHPIPQQAAETTDWWRLPARHKQHNFGATPFYWIQNRPDSTDIDGEADYDGLTDLFDEINQLLSATTRGTKANVDPTLVVKMDPAMNDGAPVRKGSENAIWSPGGAEYLELKGQAVAAAVQMLERLRTYALDASSVVLADPDKLSGAAQSAQALRILYAPMLSACDSMRETYGRGIRQLLQGMLRAAKMIGASEPYEVITEGPEGPQIEMAKASVVLPPRVVEGKLTERQPGTVEEISLNWNPYFAPTWTDIQAATTAAIAANGGKPVISQKTSVQALQSLWGVNDIEAELEQLHEEAEKALETAQRAFEQGPTAAEPALGGEEESEEEEKPEGEEAE